MRESYAASSNFCYLEALIARIDRAYYWAIFRSSRTRHVGRRPWLTPTSFKLNREHLFDSEVQHHEHHPLILYRDYLSRSRGWVHSSRYPLKPSKQYFDNDRSPRCLYYHDSVYHYRSPCSYACSKVAFDLASHELILEQDFLVGGQWHSILVDWRCLSYGQGVRSSRHLATSNRSKSRNRVVFGCCRWPD